MSRIIPSLIVASVAGCSDQTHPTPRSQPAASAPATPTRTAVAGVSSSQDVEAFITTRLAEQLAVDRSEIDINRPIGSPPLGADGLDVIEIIMEIEEHFDVAIPDKELERVTGGTQAELPMRINPSQLVTLARDVLERAGK